MSRDGPPNSVIRRPKVHEGVVRGRACYQLPASNMVSDLFRVMMQAAVFVSEPLAAGATACSTRFPMTSGSLGAFQWIEAVSQDDTGLIDAIRTLRRHLIGLRAVNVSWDSGLLIPSDEELRRGWTIEQGLAVSPVIDDRVIDAWPWCDGGWEEWYFFSTLPRDLNLSGDNLRLFRGVSSRGLPVVAHAG